MISFRKNFGDKILNNSKINFATNGIILMYHRVADVACDPWSLSVSPQHFGEQLDVLKQIFYPIRLTDLCQTGNANNLPSPWVAITFDDGYADNYFNARKILKAYEIPATFFLVSGYLNSKHGYWWDELQEILLQPGILPPISDIPINCQISEIEWQVAASYTVEEFERFRDWCWDDEDPTPRHSLFRKLYFWLRMQPERQRKRIFKKLRLRFGKTLKAFSDYQLLSLEEARSLARDNLFDIGSHTVTHQDLTSIPISQQQREIVRSKKSLEKLIKYPIMSFSYAYGSYTQDTVSLVKKAGFECACSVEEGVVTGNTDRFLLPRIQVKDWGSDKFVSKISHFISTSFVSPDNS